MVILMSLKPFIVFRNYPLTQVQAKEQFLWPMKIDKLVHDNFQNTWKISNSQKRVINVEHHCIDPTNHARTYYQA